jgi:death on curing protein
VSASKYPNVAAAGAALVQSLIHNHPFHNGNKRTALLALVVFLEARNGRYLDFDEDAIYDLIVRIASHTLLQGDVPPRHEDPYFSDREVLAIYEWIVRHTSEPEIGDHRIRWGKLEGLLRRHGCEIENRGGNRRLLRRGAVSVFTGARNAGAELDAREIRRIRQGLHLDEANGYDSPRFYGGEAPHADVGDVIGRYRGVLARLALLDRT